MKVVKRRVTATVQSERVFSPTEQPRKLNKWRIENDIEETPTLGWEPPAPWTFRQEYPTGAPRVCRSNYYWPVMMPGKEGPVQVGIIDPYLHLYSHWGMTEVSATIKIGDAWHIIYDFDTEWEVVTERGFWIEFVSDSRERVARISRRDAERFGHKMEHGGRTKWAVPMKHYTTHGRDT